jgi:integrase
VNGEGRVYKRGRWFHVAYYGPLDDGSWGEIREVVRPRTDDEEKAHDFLRRRRRAAENHRDGIDRFRGPGQERVTVAELLDAVEADYKQREIKSLRQTLGHIKPVRAWFGPARALTVNPDRVRTYIAARQKDGKSNAKINRETEILNRAFRLAVEEGKLPYSPKVPALPERNARQGFFERAEFEAVLEKLPEDLKDVARFAYLTGWRRGEIAGLGWEHVDRAGGEIRLPDSKNGEGRVLPLDEELIALIERRWAAREYKGYRGERRISPFVFHRLGKPRLNFGKRWRKACCAAGFPTKLFHDFRRTAVRDLVRGGVHQSVAMDITGHKTASVFKRYNITSREDKLDALHRRRDYAGTLDAKSNIQQLEAARRSRTES